MNLAVKDISYECYGKYQHCSMCWGLWYADIDITLMGTPRWGAKPDPSSPDTRSWRGVIVELLRRMMGAKRGQK